MKKKLYICILIMVLMCLFGCGSQDNSDLLAEIERMQNEITSLREEAATSTPADNQSKPTPQEEVAEVNTIDIEELIWDLVRPEVAGKLRQPGTAEFDELSKVKFFRIDDDVYEVLGVVRGQNALGNMVSNNYYTTVVLDSAGQPTIIRDVEFLGSDELSERIKLNELLIDRIESGQTYLTAIEYDVEVLKHPLYVDRVNYVDSSTFYGSDAMLQAILYNNSDVPIKDAVVRFVAWDKNNLPVVIKGGYSSSGSYMPSIIYDSINLMPGEYYSGRSGSTYCGMSIDDSLDISTLKAIVVSFEDFDGNEWVNPLLLDFKYLFEEKKLVA